MDSRVSAGRAVSSQKTLVVEKVRPWNDEAERGLAQTFGHDRDLLIAGVNDGSLELFKLWGGAAWMITRMEAGVLTCCCYQGAHVRDAMAAMVAESHRLGLKAIQFYTRRPGLARLLAEFHPEPQETVYRIELHGK